MKVSLNTKVMNVFCGINSKIRLNKLFDYMLECSIKQEEILKEELKDLKGSWIIYQWDVDIHDMPERFDDLTIQTYHTYTRKFYAFRNYDVFRNGKLIVRAKTKWLLVNPEKKLPMRISDELGVIYGREDGYEIIEELANIPDFGIYVIVTNFYKAYFQGNKKQSQQILDFLNQNGLNEISSRLP